MSAIQNMPTKIAKKETNPRDFLQSPRGRRVIAKALINALRYETALPVPERSPSDCRDIEFVLEKLFSDVVPAVRLEQQRQSLAKLLGMIDASASQRINVMIAEHHKAITEAVNQVRSALDRANDRGLRRTLTRLQRRQEKIRSHLAAVN